MPLQRTKVDVLGPIDPSTGVDPRTGDPVMQEKFALTLPDTPQQEGSLVIAEHASQRARRGSKPRKPMCPACEELVSDNETKLVCRGCKKWTHVIEREWTPQIGWHGCYDPKRDQCQFCTEKEYKAYAGDQRQKRTMAGFSSMGEKRSKALLRFIYATTPRFNIIATASVSWSGC